MLLVEDLALSRAGIHRRAIPYKGDRNICRRTNSQAAQILDACRNNPLAGRGLRSTDGGLAQMRAPEGTLISYATQPGNVAQDGDGGNSPYTKALAQTIRRAGLDVFQTFNEVGLAVKRSTGGQQQPWVSSSPIDGKFYFVDPPATVSISKRPPCDE